MIVYYILLAILIVSRIKYKHKGFYSEYLSFDTTNAIKGVFIALVFISHITPYIRKVGYDFYNDFGDKLFIFLNAYIGQWIVAMFLFYSGYGVMESIKRKGVDYVASIPRKRVLTTLVNFNIAVVVFALISLFTPNDYTIKNYILSFTGWESVGNSNWYIFVILLCYFITYLSFRKCVGNSGSYAKGAIVSITLLLILMIVLSFFKESWWYDTMLCFGAGIIFSLLRERIEPVAKKYYWIVILILLLLLIGLSYVPFSMNGLVYNIYCSIFCLLIVMLTMKVKINNLALIWAGKNLFPLYIYQRVPMILFSTIGGGSFVASHPSLYTSLCLLITILIAHLYKFWTIKF